MRAIDARSIDHLRAEHCQSLLLCFKDVSLERKVSAGMMEEGYDCLILVMFFSSLLSMLANRIACSAFISTAVC